MSFKPIIAPQVRITREGFRTLAEAMINPEIERIFGKEYRDHVINNMVNFGIAVQDQLIGYDQPTLFCVQSEGKED